MSGTPPSLDPTSCRGRQDKLRGLLEKRGLDAAVFFDRHYAYALTGYWHGQPLTPTAVLIALDGEAAIVTHEENPEAPAADRVIPYVPNHLFTLKANLSGELATALNPSLRSFTAIGTCQQTPSALLEAGRCEDVTEDYQYLRRHKDPDEVEALRFTITCADRAYEVAHQTIEPGVTELEVMSAMLEEATFAGGEILSGWGQDFLCGAPGGFARRNREIEAGELYILDVGVGVRGYRCDLCRTISVDGELTKVQREAYEHILKVITLGESMLRPGQSCREMYEAIHAELEGWQGHSFIHHVGHGIGLDAHEVPRINPAWDDTFELGDLIAFEPGLYSESLRGGFRLENNYLITEEGFLQLSQFPLDPTLSSS
ncbi:MAG: Xaa-Pro peptidase family protein [Verrucomicrobiota bacterium]